MFFVNKKNLYLKTELNVKLNSFKIIFNSLNYFSSFFLRYANKLN